MQATDTNGSAPAAANETAAGPLWSPGHAECPCWSSNDDECPWRA